tara:strand:+ start:157616 stop:158662 length:1047 start_codon:yes stop_codon:yes gene_type:complete
MLNWQKIIVSPETPIIDTMKLLEEYASQLIIVAKDMKMLGTITDGDIRRAILSGVDLKSPSMEIMFKDFTFATPDTPREVRLSIMKDKLINGLPILNKDRLVLDVVSLHDLNTINRFDNNVVLMAGGLGSRLGDLTQDCPKPMLKIGEKPILENIIENFLKYGFGNFHLSVNYKSEIIEDHFQDGSHLNAKISYLKENKRLGTAGSLSLLDREKINSPFIVMNGDLLTKVDFAKLIKFHEESGNTATMCIRQYDVQIPYGVINCNHGEIVSIVEKPTQSYFVNAGIYVFSPDALDVIPNDHYFEMTTLFENLLKVDKKTGVFPIHEYWLDIGRVDDLVKAKTDMKNEF